MTAKNIFKRILLKTLISLAAFIALVVIFVMLYSKNCISNTTLDKVTVNTPQQMLLSEKTNDSTIGLQKSKDSEKYFNEIYEIFNNKSISLHKISSDKANSIISQASYIAAFDEKNNYFISPDGDIIVKVLSSDIKEMNFLNKFILLFNKDKYFYYSGKSEEFINIAQKINTILTKFINYSDEDEIYAAIGMLTPLRREFGSEDEKKASQLIKDKLTAYGYETSIQEFTYIPKISNSAIYGTNQVQVLTDVPITQAYEDIEKHIKEHTRNSQNVISTKKSSSKSKGIIIICAHYDCVIENGSTGAIDNGSGVSAVIEIARCLKDISGDYELRFIFFGGEEFLLQGSKYYVENLNENEKSNIKAVINLDTIGSKSGSRFAMVTSDGKENNTTNILKKHADELGIQIEEGPKSSDHHSFHVYGIPSLTIGQFPADMSNMQADLNIHSSNDKIENVDTAKIKIIADMVIHALRELMIK